MAYKRCMNDLGDTNHAGELAATWGCSSLNLNKLIPLKSLAVIELYKRVVSRFLGIINMVTPMYNPSCAVSFQDPAASQVDFPNLRIAIAEYDQPPGCSDCSAIHFMMFMLRKRKKNSSVDHPLF